MRLKYSDAMRIRCCALVTLLLFASQKGAQGDTAKAGDSLLDRLVGRWTMTGTVRGKPATYTMEASWTIQKKYVELHMVDVAGAKGYEARVFIGPTQKPGELVAHWIDSTGAQYSVPPATGTLNADELVLDFPYPDGAFHDVFTYDRKADRFRFVLDASDGRGGWKRFAEYEVRRSSP